MNPSKKSHLPYTIIILLTFLVTACIPDSLAEQEKRLPVEATMTTAAQQLSETGGVPNYQTGFSVTAWPGKIFSLPPDSPYDDYLEWSPEGTGTTGIKGVSFAIDSQIMAIKNSRKIFLFWGLLTCNDKIDDYNQCQLVVTDLQPIHQNEGAINEPVEGWSGKIISEPLNNETNYSFILNGDFPVKIYITGQNEIVLSAFELVKNSDIEVKIWGNLLTGNTANGIEIDTTGIVIPTDTPIPLKTAAPAIEKLSPDVSSEWTDYAIDDPELSFQYPPSANIIESGMVSSPSGEIVEILSSTEYHEQYSGEYNFTPLCVLIEYQLGYIAINTPANVTTEYATCGRSLSSTGNLIGKQETVNLSGKEFTANGFEFIGNTNRLIDHHETYSVYHPEGFHIEFGSLESDNHSYSEYLQISKNVILQILKTITIS